MFKAMEDGKVLSADILPIVSGILANNIGPGLAQATNRSSAWQGRFGTARGDFMKRFSQSGGDAGLATLWRTLTVLTDKAAANAERFGKWFETASAYVSNFLIDVSQIAEFLYGAPNGDNFLVKMFGQDTADRVAKIRENTVAIVQEVVTLIGAITSSGAFKSFIEALALAVDTLVSSLKALLELINGKPNEAGKTLGGMSDRTATTLGIDPVAYAMGDSYGLSSVMSNLNKQANPNVPGAAIPGNTVVGDSNVSVTNNITVQSPTQIEEATQGATQGSVNAVRFGGGWMYNGAVHSSPPSYKPNSGQ